MNTQGWCSGLSWRQCQTRSAAVQGAGLTAPLLANAELSWAVPAWGGSFHCADTQRAAQPLSCPKQPVLPCCRGCAVSSDMGSRAGAALAAWGLQLDDPSSLFQPQLESF